MMHRLAAAIALALLSATAALAGETVHVESASRTTKCAEEDNVYVKFSHPGITRLAIEALHPAYLPRLEKDDNAADFTDCDMSRDVTYPFTPKHVVLYENKSYRLVGHTFGRFWRPESVEFRVGKTVVRGLHLVQLIRKIEGHRIEILVVYPSDGYWRAKPLPPTRFKDTAYGSSFLVGPIEEDGRPYVPMSSIEFVPSKLLFRLRFKNGEGTLRVAEATRERTRLEVKLPPSAGTAPFAALRSMFVSPLEADTAEAVIAAPGYAPVTIPLPDFVAAETGDVTFARSVPSRHNTSAPDMRFADFGR